MTPRLTLRPEATASVVRAYIEHGMQTRPGNVKLYYMGPMFRRERPQKGRYRQFYQIGAELLGPSDAPAIDAEVIEMLLAFFERVELEGRGAAASIPLADKECRPAICRTIARRTAKKCATMLGPDSQRRIETNPLRVLDSKLDPRSSHHRKAAAHRRASCATTAASITTKLKRQLALRGIAYQENWRLVRGLDYYMRTTFEVTATGLGSQNAVCGGGRYDGLVELLGGPADDQGHRLRHRHGPRGPVAGAAGRRRQAGRRPSKSIWRGWARRLILLRWRWRRSCAGRELPWSCPPSK